MLAPARVHTVFISRQREVHPRPEPVAPAQPCTHAARKRPHAKLSSRCCWGWQCPYEQRVEPPPACNVPRHPTHGARVQCCRRECLLHSSYTVWWSAMRQSKAPALRCATANTAGGKNARTNGRSQGIQTPQLQHIHRILTARAERQASRSRFGKQAFSSTIQPMHLAHTTTLRACARGHLRRAGAPPAPPSRGRARRAMQQAQRPAAAPFGARGAAAASTVTDVFVLDFDGVLVDSEPEVSMSAFTAARDYWPAAFSGAGEQQQAALLKVREPCGRRRLPPVSRAHAAAATGAFCSLQPAPLRAACVDNGCAAAPACRPWRPASGAERPASGRPPRPLPLRTRPAPPPLLRACAPAGRRWCAATNLW